MQKRPVTIHDLELLSYDPPDARIFVHCSKGTYIRSLARDIALSLNTRAHLISLNRTQIAGFSLTEADSASLRGLDEDVFAKIGISSLTVSEKTSVDMINGKDLTPMIGDRDEEKISVFRDSGDFICIIEKKSGIWHYGYVYARI
jgi:tRNA pseudouridine55 synthase